MAGAEVRIVSDSGAALPDRAVGEILIRAEYMFQGYYRAPELTARSFRDGWFQSGDLGYLVDGDLYVTGRKSDLIICEGRNLHPEELERIADATPGLSPGRSVAFAVSDPALGSDRIVMVCEATASDSDQQLSVERTLRRAADRRDARRRPRGGAGLGGEDLERQVRPLGESPQVSRAVWCNRPRRCVSMTEDGSANAADGVPAARVYRRLREFICTELIGRPSYPLGDDEPLMSGGLIDSMSVARLGVFIEREFDRYILDVDLTVENMDTLRRIVAIVMATPA
jgi:acyl carrier protein